MRLTSIISLTAGAALLSGCATGERQPGRMSRAETARQRDLIGGGGDVSDLAARFQTANGSPRIQISLGSQQAYFYKGGELVTASQVSTGRPGYRTPRGSYSISSKEELHHSTLYGQYIDGSGSVVNGDADVRNDPRPKGARFAGAPMPYFMRFNGGIGMHAGHLPGYPASHGCVRLPRQMAQVFFQHAPVGTPVTVTD